MYLCQKCKKPCDLLNSLRCRNCNNAFHAGCLIKFRSYSNIDTTRLVINSCPGCDQRDETPTSPNLTSVDTNNAEIIALQVENLLLQTELDELKNVEQLTKLFYELKQDLMSSLSHMIKQEFSNIRATMIISGHKEVVTDSPRNDTNLCISEDDVEPDDKEKVTDDHTDAKPKIVAISNKYGIDFIELLKDHFPDDVYDFVPVVDPSGLLKELVQSDNIPTELNDRDIIAIFGGQFEVWEGEIPDCDELRKLLSDNFGKKNIILLGCPYYAGNTSTAVNRCIQDLNLNFHTLATKNRNIEYLDPNIQIYNQCECKFLSSNSASTRCTVNVFVDYITKSIPPSQSSEP